MRIFAQLTKVDLEKREVWGRAVEEVPDKAQEIFDYATSRPLFDAWSADFEKVTDGKSLGNVRAMHGKTAAGKLIAYLPNDAEKAIDIGVKVVDEGEWAKVAEGVYTGFSIGGEYAKKWQDGTLTRYTAKPSEISLVDNPCVPTARFQVVKADGSTEERAFQKVAARSDVSPKEGEHKYGDVTFADPKNKKYPIDTEAHIRAAWNYINKPKNAGKYSAADLQTIKDHIVAAWKEKISSDGPPSADDAEKFAAATLVKGMYDVSMLAGLIQSIQGLAFDALYEAEWEQDGSLLPEQLKAWLQLGVEILKDMTAEETEELVTALSQRDGSVVEMLELAAQAQMAKAGKRHSKADQDLVQAVHDHAVALGAGCAPAPDDEEAEKLAKRASDLEAAEATLAKQVGALTTERDALQKRVAELEAQPAAPKGVTRAVGKAADSDAPPKEEIEPDPKNPVAVMKAVHATGGRLITRSPQ